MRSFVSFVQERKNERKKKAHSDMIDMQIEEDGIKLKRECKILVLGPPYVLCLIRIIHSSRLGVSGSGKSTIVKQMKIIHQNGCPEEELLTLRPLIRRNLLEYARNIVNALDKFQLQPAAPHNQLNLQRLLDYRPPDDTDVSFDLAIARAAYDLCTDDIITLLMDHSHDFDLMDSAP
jgi:guanine nucleotide-binding protein G(i) subunit alpha